MINDVVEGKFELRKNAVSEKLHLHHMDEKNQVPFGGFHVSCSSVGAHTFQPALTLPTFLPFITSCQDDASASTNSPKKTAYG